MSIKFSHQSPTPTPLIFIHNGPVIGDIYHLFQKDKSADFIESTLNLLCESCYFLDIRIILVLNLDRLDELQGAILPKTFSDPSCKRYTIDFQEQSNKITIRPKDEF
jgi:hypothetical protein